MTLTLTLFINVLLPNLAWKVKKAHLFRNFRGLYIKYRYTGWIFVTGLANDCRFYYARYNQNQRLFLLFTEFVSSIVYYT